VTQSSDYMSRRTRADAFFVCPTSGYPLCVRRYDNYLADAIASKYYRFEPFLRQAIQNVVKQHMPDYETDDNDKHKEFWVSFYSLPSVCHLRELRTDKIGQLVAITGTITRTSEVRTPTEGSSRTDRRQCGKLCSGRGGVSIEDCP